MKKRKAVVAKRKPPQKIENVASSPFSQSLPFFEPGNLGTQINQVNTLFVNNRWYFISNMRQLLSEIYVEHGLIQTVVDVPVDDGLRGGVEIKTKQLSPEQIEDVKSEMEEFDDMGVVGYSHKWDRLYGGAGVVIMTDQDPKTPLNWNAITEKTPLKFRDVDMWELFWSRQTTSDYAEVIDDQSLNPEFYDYYGITLHNSRVMKLTGLRAPSFLRPRLRGWGFSITEAIVNSVNQYLKSNNLTFEVLDEFKVDYYKMKGLASLLLTGNASHKVRQRIADMNATKNFQNAVVLDSEDDFEQKHLSFTGIAEAMTGIRMQVASDLRMPLTKVFGISAAGFSSGEDDIENYNGMVERQIREKAKRNILQIIKLRCQRMFGFIPDDMQIDFKPLRILSAEQEENVKSQQFTRILSAKQAGELDTKEFRDAVNKENLLGIQLDANKTMLSVDNPEEGTDSASETPAVSSPKSSLSAPEAKE